MPELPEVETIRLGLERYVVGKKIIGVEVRLQKILQGNIKNIIGAKFAGFRRFGKALSLDLNNGYSILVHVKMTGQLVYCGKVEQVENVEPVRQTQGKHTHVIFHLKGGTLYYNDIRQFGWVEIIQKSKIKSQKFVRRLGTDALKLTFQEFKQIISNKPTKIKQLLMDQEKIAGIGNIYANDAFFLAGIDPRRPAKSLSNDEAKKLYQSIIEVLKRGLKYGGSSEFTYVNALGESGEYQKHFLVYGKAKQSCSNCKTLIQRITLGGRGTFFCSHCQN